MTDPKTGKKTERRIEGFLKNIFDDGFNRKIVIEEFQNEKGDLINIIEIKGIIIYKRTQFDGRIVVFKKQMEKEGLINDDSDKKGSQYLSNAALLMTKSNATPDKDPKKFIDASVGECNFQYYGNI